MSIAPNTVVTVRRLSADSSRKSDYTGIPVLTGIPCCVQPLSEEPEQGFDGRATYKRFVALDFGKVLDIREDDRFVDANGNVYTVRGVQKWNEPEIGGEMEILLTQAV